MRIFSPYKLALAVSLSLLLGTASQLSAISVATDPVGFITITAKPVNITPPANNPGGLTYIALGMARPVAYQSNIPTTATIAAAGNGTSITFATNIFSQGQFGAASSNYLEILTGASAGFTTDITGSTLNSLTVADNIANAIANDGTTTFRVRPYWTIGTAFGANAAGFQTGTTSSSAAADLVQSVNPSNGAVTSFFYNSQTTRWEYVSGNADASNVVIPPDVGLQVVRPNSTGAGDLTFKLTGDVKTGQSGLRIERLSGADTINLVSQPYAVESVLLKDSKLENILTGGVPNTSGLAPSADIVRILDPVNNAFNDYYYDTVALKWKCGFTDASLAVIPVGYSASIIRKLGTAQVVSWFAPQPGMVLGDTPLSLALIGAVSRKSHTTYGVAELNLPVTGPSAVENRDSASTHTVVVKFNNQITAGSAAVTAITGTNPQPLNAIGITSTISGKELVISLTNVNNQQKVTLTVSGVTTAGQPALNSFNVPVRFLAGDVNGSGGVTAGDLQGIKNYLAQKLTLADIRVDTNFSGSTITAGDLQTVKNNLPKSVPDL